MKKTRLIVDYEYEFELIGIISSTKFYKLAWAINNCLDIRFVKGQDHEVGQKNGAVTAFGHYCFEEEQSILQLFKNKAEGEGIQYLIPEMSHLDYILRIETGSQTFAKEEVIKALRDVKWIEYIAALEVEKLKSRDNFLS